MKDATLNCSSKEERREKRDKRDKHDRDDRDEGGNGPVPEMTRSERSEKCAKRLNNEQLNCNCTATGLALSRVCILIGKRATAREEGKEKREERREMVRSQKGGMVEKRVGP